MRIESRHVCSLDTDGGYIAGWGIGWDERVYLLECLGLKDDSWFDRKTKCDWRVHSIRGDGAHDTYSIHDQIRNYNVIQPIHGGLLLAGSRCQFAGNDTSPNAHIFDFGGELMQRVLLGDGIQKVQSMATGDIWVAYFDEGIFGNLGWNRPIGSPGLIRFDSKGNQIYKFEPRLGLDYIVDCYALNIVTTNEAWCYYYTQFSVVQIVNDRVHRSWACPVKGACEMAVWRDLVAMPSGYEAADWTLLRLKSNNTAEPTAILEFVDGSGDRLSPSASTCRGDAIWFIEGAKIYRTALRELKV